MTSEQQSILELANKGESFKIMAYAGTGKTTTLKLISEAWPKKSGLYLAFNKAIQTEASKKFPDTVDCRTFHSLAFRNTDKAITDKLRLPRIPPTVMASKYGIEPLAVRLASMDGSKILEPRSLARIVNQSVFDFCLTGSIALAQRHISVPDGIHPDDIAGLQSYLLPFAQRKWQDSINPANRSGIGHEIYLKHWSLSNPVIPADYILFDEAQDSDPLMLSVLLSQTSTQVIYVGDPHQQIYAWRGAVNAMQALQLPQERLTQSFRFGDTVAGSANMVLRLLGETVPISGNPKKISTVHMSPIDDGALDAVLCRSNASVIQNLIYGLSKNHKVAIQADTSQMIEFIEGAKKIQDGERSDHRELMMFESWIDVIEFVESGEGSGLLPLVKLIEQHGADNLKAILESASKVENADYIISTAHKAKGLEWDNVRLDGGFIYKIDENGLHISPEELRLIYVAMTRAQCSLDISNLNKLLAHPSFGEN
jgi:energy-coupling factor transporter ATP-binding protein EcfA2